MVGNGVGFIQRQRLSITFGRAVPVAGLFQCPAKIVVRADIAGLELDRTPIATDRFGCEPSGKLGAREPPVRCSIRRSQRSRAPEVACRDRRLVQCQMQFRDEGEQIAGLRPLLEGQLWPPPGRRAGRRFRTGSAQFGNWVRRRH